MRRLLDKRIRGQRKALRENWMIVDMRQNGNRHFTRAVIRKAVELCDLLEVPRTSPQGGTFTLLHRMSLAAIKARGEQL